MEMLRDAKQWPSFLRNATPPQLLVSLGRCVYVDLNEKD